jgi:RsiW-degrading membrane proteinase PrsW (M82 family)
MSAPFETGRWFNQSRRVLIVTAVGVAIGFVLLCAAMGYMVAQYFVCIGQCTGSTPPFLLLLVSAFFGMIPALGTLAIGYFIVRGLWEDARRIEAEAGGKG